MVKFLLACLTMSFLSLWLSVFSLHKRMDQRMDRVESICIPLHDGGADAGR